MLLASLVRGRSQSLHRQNSSVHHHECFVGAQSHAESLKSHMNGISHTS